MQDGVIEFVDIKISQDLQYKLDMERTSVRPVITALIVAVVLIIVGAV